MRVTVVIPARMAATRFPGKPLEKINHRPIIEWVYERSSKANVDAVLVATDSQEIFEAVQAFGGNCCLTSPHHPNGTSRIAEAAEQIDADVIVNVQGDEPSIHPEVINAVIAPFAKDPNLHMATMANPLTIPEDLFNPNIVKVVLNRQQHALYFSRAAIPYHKHLGMHDPQFPMPEHPYYKHIGIYAYRKSFLLAYAAEPPSALETVEGLEQLRALDMGTKIYVGLTHHTSIGVDEPGDLEKARAFLASEGRVEDD